MGDLIRRDLRNDKRMPFSDRTDVIQFIEFDCSIGFRPEGEDELGKNEFMLKCRLGEGFLIPMLDLICYGIITEFAGQVFERTIDKTQNTVTYYGLSAHANTEGYNKVFISGEGFTYESYTPKTLTFDSSQMGLVIDNIFEYAQSAGYKQKNKTTIYPNSQIADANLGDTITVIDKEYNVTASGILVEKYLHIQNNQERIEYTLEAIE